MNHDVILYGGIAALTSLVAIAFTTAFYYSLHSDLLIMNSVAY
jgi:hypothetical protein